jgi:hypothetical protein
MVAARLSWNDHSPLELANLSDVGLHRSDNEDYYCYVEPETTKSFCAMGG